MKWIGKRISFIDDKTRTTIVIYPENVFWVKALMGAWVAMWLVIGLTMLWAFTTLKLSEKEKIIVVVFLVFWFYYAIRVFRSFFWLLWGKELIKIDEVSLTYKRSVRSFGKATPYYFENIQKMSLMVPETRSVQAVWEASPWVQGGERIYFDYLGKQIKYARKLNQKDSEQLFRFITKKMEDKLKRIRD